MAERKTLSCRFRMLTHRLYDLFVKYFSSGKVRAPPESELYDLRSTFQHGAKIHRRSLQCKFKSWAKRMVFDNGCLRSANSGKLILPIERCEDVVVKLHGNRHLSVGEIIVEVQKIYTWTKRNFGMDVDDVVRVVLASCSRKECKVQTLHNYAFLKSNNAMPLFQNMNEFENEERQYCTPSARNSIEVQSPFSSSNNNFDAMARCSSDRFNFISPAATPVTWKNKLRRRKLIENTDRYSGPSPLHNVIPPKSFKKVRNAIQLSKLLKEAKRAPAEYPAVLTDKKTVFLSSFGLVPKKICSSKVVLEFEDETIRKEQLEKHIYSLYSRRLLRDRTKVKTITNTRRSERKKQIYLSMAKKRYNLRGVRLDFSKDLFASKDAWRSNFTDNSTGDRSHPKGEDSSSDEENDFSEVLSAKHLEKESMQFRAPVETSRIASKSSTEPNLFIPKEKLPNNPESIVRSAFNAPNSSCLQQNIIRNQQGPSKPSNLLEYRVSEQCQLPFVAPMFIPMPNYSPAIRFLNGSHINQFPEFPDTVLRPSIHPSRNDSAEMKTHATVSNMPNQVIPVFLNPKYIEAVHQCRKVPRQASPASAPFKEIKLPQPLIQKLPKKLTPQIIKFIQVPRKILPKNEALEGNAIAPFVVRVAGAAKGAPYDTNDKIEPSQTQGRDNLQCLKLRETINGKVDLEIIRFLKWMNQMKSRITATLFQNGIDKYSQQMDAQLELGIYIVRGIRKALKDVEQRTSTSVPGNKDLKQKSHF